MKFIDTHIHLQDYRAKYTTDIVADAIEKGVEKFVCVGTSPADWAKVEEIYRKSPERIVPAFGLHPWHIAETAENWCEQLEELLKKYPQAMIGECGLDGNREPALEEQGHFFFRRQLDLAKKYNRAVLIHAVKCGNELDYFWTALPPRCVFHSYNGRREQLKRILAAGAYVSFSFSVLSNRDCEELVNMVPDNRILLETDGPYQSPVPHTETLPDQLPELALLLSGLRDEGENRLAELSYKNALELINGGN